MQYIGDVLFLPKLERDVKLIVERDYGVADPDKRFVMERTCKQEVRGWSTEGDHARVWLTCGHDCMVPTVQDLPNYCPNCGAKVIEDE